MAWKKFKKAKANKYSAQKTSIDGIWFDSKLEAAVYELLKLRQAAGEIEIVKCQDRIYLSAARILYTPDFFCKDLKTGLSFHVEGKGVISQRWPTIKRLWKEYGPDSLEIWMGEYRKPYLKQIIVPKTKGEKNEIEIV